MNTLIEGPHAGYILAAYLLAGAVVLGLILISALDGRIQKKALERLESLGVGRRSARQNEAD